MKKEMAVRIVSSTLLARNNCFSVKTEDDNEYNIVNFYYETFNDLLDEKILEWPVRISILKEKVALIDDVRVAERYYNDQYCTSCCPRDLLTEPQRMSIDRQVEKGMRKYFSNGTYSIGSESSRLLKKDMKRAVRLD